MNWKPRTVLVKKQGQVRLTYLNYHYCWNETRPPDGGAFNRADYYRTALKQLGEQSYERRLLVDIDTEQTWSKKGRARTKTTQFNDSPELRQALEDAFAKRGVRAVILDEAQQRDEGW